MCPRHKERICAAGREHAPSPELYDGLGSERGLGGVPAGSGTRVGSVGSATLPGASLLCKEGIRALSPVQEKPRLFYKLVSTLKWKK